MKKIVTTVCASLFVIGILSMGAVAFIGGKKVDREKFCSEREAVWREVETMIRPMTVREVEARNQLWADVEQCYREQL